MSCSNSQGKSWEERLLKTHVNTRAVAKKTIIDIFSRLVHKSQIQKLPDLGCKTYKYDMRKTLITLELLDGFTSCKDHREAWERAFPHRLPKTTTNHNNTVWRVGRRLTYRNMKQKRWNSNKQTPRNEMGTPGDGQSFPRTDMWPPDTGH